MQRTAAEQPLQPGACALQFWAATVASSLEHCGICIVLLVCCPWWPVLRRLQHYALWALPHCADALSVPSHPFCTAKKNLVPQDSKSKQLQTRPQVSKRPLHHNARALSGNGSLSVHKESGMLAFQFWAALMAPRLRIRQHHLHATTSNVCWTTIPADCHDSVLTSPSSCPELPVSPCAAELVRSFHPTCVFLS